MFFDKNIPIFKIQSVVDVPLLDQLLVLIKNELQSFFPRIQNPYLILKIIDALHIERVLTLRKVSRSHRITIDWYMALTSISYPHTAHEYHPNPKNIQRLKITQGALSTETMQLITPLANTVRFVEILGNSIICPEYLNQFFHNTGMIEILSFRHYMTLHTSVLKDVFEHNPHLQILDLSFCQNLDGEIIMPLIKKTQTLEILFLDNCPWVELTRLTELLISPGKLRRISLKNIPKIQTRHLRALQKMFKSVWIEL